jgi:hypothetical protein
MRVQRRTSCARLRQLVDGVQQSDNCCARACARRFARYEASACGAERIAATSVAPHVPRLRLFVSQRPQTHIPIEDRNRRNDFLNALEQEPSGFIAACVAEWQQGRAVGVERDSDEDNHYVKADLQPDDEDAANRLQTAAASVVDEFISGRMSDNECRAALIDALVVDNCLVRALRLGAHGKRTAAIRLVAAMGEVVSVLCGGSVICLRC